MNINLFFCKFLMRHFSKKKKETWQIMIINIKQKKKKIV